MGLAGTRTGLSLKDPISSGLSAVHSFAFAGLATSLIGYAVSFPKKVTDTLELISVKFNLNHENSHKLHACPFEVGRIGAVTFTPRDGLGKAGKLLFG